MSRLYQCNQCEGYSDDVPFELMQTCEEVDDDGEPIVIVVHLCTTQCLCDYAMGIALGLFDVDTVTDT